MSFISPVATDVNGNAKTTGGQQVLGKDDFLQLLVTKLQNQDPLSPMEDEDFIAQLAQFSSLEQMNNIAGAISESNELELLQAQSVNNTMAAGLIGKDVKATYDSLYLDSDNEPRLSYTTDKYADQVVLTIKDSEGTTVATITQGDVEAGAHTVTWDGTDNQGNRAAEGYYTVEAVASVGDDTTFSPSLSLTGTIETVIYREGNAYVTVAGIEIPLGDITAVGEAGAFSEDDG